MTVKLLITLFGVIVFSGLMNNLLHRLEQAPRLPTHAGTQALHQLGEKILAMNWPWVTQYLKWLTPVLRETPLPAGMTSPLFLAGHFFAGLPLWVLMAFALPRAAGLLFLPCLGVGMVLPYIWLKRRQTLYHATLLKSLPEWLDLQALMMEAGLDLSAGLKHYLEKGTPGPLLNLLNDVQRDIQMGRSRQDAYADLGRHTTFLPLRDTCRVIVQGLNLGTRLAPLLREQASALRVRRMRLAEKKAAEAPIKVLFPLFVFIFPTLFIVLLGPLVLLFKNGGF